MSTRHWSLRAYLIALVVLFVVVIGFTAVYGSTQSTDNAQHAAAQDASFAASLASRDVSSALAQVKAEVAQVAATPGLAEVFAGPSDCTLTFAGAGGFTSGHLDVVSPAGKVGCTSLASSRGVGYAGAPWLQAALGRPTFAGPVADPRTGGQAVLETAPVKGGGAVVVFLSLDSLGPGLAATFGGPDHLEFLVTSRGGTVLARSIDSAHWVGRKVAGTPFAHGGNGVDRRDVDGTARIYGHAEVAATGWTVYAGADRAKVLASTDSLVLRELWVCVAGLIILLAAGLVLYRRIARPVELLSSEVRAAATHTGSGAVNVASAPREVATLAEDFNELVATVDRELSAASRLAALVESSEDAILGTTLDGLVTSWNAGATRMYGYTAEEVVGHEVSLLFPPDRLGELSTILAQVAGGESVEPHETQRVRKDGTLFDVSVGISPIRDLSGATVGASSVVRDITHRKQQEAERAALQERLDQSQRLESLGQLAGGVAHDFNNLLGAIINFAAFVREEVAAAAGQEGGGHWGAVRDDVDQIALAAERATRLTHQLLAFARRDVIQPEVLSLNDVVEGIEQLLRRTIGEDIEMAVALGPDLRLTTIDPGQLEQVLVNLAVNARDAMPSGGRLSVQTSNVDVDAAYATGRPNLQAGSYVQLRISDTGAGMSPEVIEHAFEPFYTTKPKGEGTGLGLATIYGIVTHAGGYVALYSEPDLGTTVTVLLPESPEEGTRHERRDEVHRRGGGESVLVVEDEEALREVTRRILERGGYRVVVAGSGEEALEAVESLDGGLDLLLTDVVMPGMLGRELAERVAERHPDTAVLFMSGYAESVLDARGRLQAGVTLVTKPFSQAALFEKVAEVLHARSRRPDDRPLWRLWRQAVEAAPR